MRCRKLRNRGQSPCGPTAVTLVRWSSCLCGRSLLVRRSITPSGVLSSHGSASHCPTVAANRRSTVARYKTAETVLALPTRSEARFSHSVAASSQRMRARPAAFRVSSCFHRVPSQTIHRPHLSTKRRSPACRSTKRRESAASEKGDVPCDDCLRGSSRRSLTALANPGVTSRELRSFAMSADPVADQDADVFHLPGCDPRAEFDGPWECARLHLPPQRRGGKWEDRWDQLRLSDVAHFGQRAEPIGIVWHVAVLHEAR